MGVWENLSYAGPELLLVIGGMALLVIGVYRGDAISREISLAAVVVLGAALVAAIFAPAGEGVGIFDDSFRIDALSTFAKIIIYAAAAFAIHGAAIALASNIGAAPFRSRALNRLCAWW